MARWKLAGVVSIVAALVIDLRPAPADACGQKGPIRATRVRKAVTRSSNPSSMLLVGVPSKRLQHDLAAAGHDVETVPSTSAAKRQFYSVVLVDSATQVGEARAKFKDAIVVVLSDDVVADFRSVENQVARRPFGAAPGRKVVDAGPDHNPTGARPLEHVPVAQSDQMDGGEEKKITAVQIPTSEQAAAVHTTGSSMDLHDEVFFTLGSATVGNKARLDKAAKWLADNADAHVSIQGYADPTGSAQINLALSQSRARSVRDYLVATGIDASRIEVKAFGDTLLKYVRTDPRNRRVSIEAKH